MSLALTTLWGCHKVGECGEPEEYVMCEQLTVNDLRTHAPESLCFFTLRLNLENGATMRMREAGFQAMHHDAPAA